MGNRRDFLRIAAASALLGAPAARAEGKAARSAGVMVNDVHSQLNATRVHAVVAPSSLDEVRSALRRARAENRALCIAGGRHAMGGQAFAADALLLDTRALARVLSFDAQRGLIEVGAGMQWPQLLDELVALQRGAPRAWAFKQKQTGADRLTMGGSLSANAHGRGLTLPPLAGDIESFTIVDARGDLLECSRSDNRELFSLAIGGYGLFGIVYSVKLRLAARRKLERVVEVRSIEGLTRAFDERIAAGFLYGDFQYSIDERSGDFLRRGVFSCYRPVPDDRPLPEARKELAASDWTDLLYLAHADKAEAFRRYAAYYLSTNGQLYWSDEHQMSIYPDGYHRILDRRLHSRAPSSEAITEIYCERASLEAFMADVRRYALEERFEIVYGTIRLVEQDRDSFLAWARKPYACVIFNLHVVHTADGLRRAARAFRGLIDIGLRYGGSYFPTYHRYALRRQVEACFPQFRDFLALKRKYDPGERFQSEWYRHYRRMFA